MTTWEEIVQRFHIKHYNRLAKVTKPALDCFDIGSVNYLKIFPDARFVYLTDRPECVEYYISEQFYRCDPFFKHPDFFNNGFIWEESCSNNSYKQFLCNLTHKFDLHSPLVLINKKMNFVEMFSFSGSTDVAVQNLYLKHAQLLRKFTEYYKKELGTLLRQMEEEEFSLTDLVGTSFYSGFEDRSIKTEAIYAFLKALGKQADVEKAASLSHQERNCLKGLIHGNSAKDSALELNLSHRTVEFYLENIKNKLNCEGKRELCMIGRDFENLGLL